MKIAFFGYDFMVPVVERLIKEGHEFLTFYSFPCDGVVMSNSRLKALALQLNIPVHEDRITPSMIEEASTQGVEVFFSAGYPHKIPPIQEGIKGINLHPTLLPEGRGIIPMPYLIYENKQAAGMTLHKLNEDFDCGDIIAQYPFKLSSSETMESLNARVSVHAPDFVVETFKNLEQKWRNATPQKPGEGSHYKHPSREMRTLNFSKSVSDIERLSRAFGKMGVFVSLQEQDYLVTSLSVWEEQHDYSVGQVISVLSHDLVVAASNGFVVLNNPVPIQID